jgi:hypothetical protein
MPDIETSVHRFPQRLATAARERLTPEYRERQWQIFRAEGERDRILADSPRPFRDEYPNLTRAYFMAPFLGGAVVASFMRLRPAFSQKAHAIAGDSNVTESVSNVADEGGASAVVTLLNPAAAVYSRATWETSWMAADTTFGAAAGGGVRKAAQDTDAVQFRFESGNIASAKWALYGLI